MYLEDSAREVPPVAIANAAREALRMSDMLQTMLNLSRSSLSNGNAQSINHARYINTAISRLDNLITEYLALLEQENLSSSDTRNLEGVINFSSNIAHAASICVSGLLAHASQLRRHAWALSNEQQDELSAVMDRLIRNQRQASALFMAEDLKTARYLAFEKDHFRDIETSAAERYMKNIKAGQIDTADIGSLYLEILRDIKAINSHLVGAAAYPILAKHNELLPNRLRIRDD